jgi:hypothetical protein
MMVGVANVLRYVLVRRGVARLGRRNDERRARDAAGRKAKGDQYDKSSLYRLDRLPHRGDGNRLFAVPIGRKKHSAGKKAP